jgi:hypothetical protein
MCVPKSIRLFVSIFTWFKLVFMLYLFGTGCYFAQSNDLQAAFGIEFVTFGVGLIFLSLISISMLFPFRYGINRHNRFLLAFVFIMETIVFSSLIGLGSNVLSYTVPVFPKSMQSDCLRKQPETFTIGECEAFYNHQRTAGFRVFWTSYYSRRNDKYANQMLADIESGICCGFFQPFRCTENTSKFPPKFNADQVKGELKKQRVTCSEHANYYPQQSDCVDYIDFAAGIIGGCNYDLGTGFCLEQEIDPGTVGCASATEDFVSALIKPHALLFIGLSILNFLYMCLACVMWWKRKESDVFPTYVDDKKKIV